MNKRIFTVVLSLAFIIGIAAFLAGCDNGSTDDGDGGGDEWVKVDVTKLAGTWARTVNQTKDIDEVYTGNGIETTVIDGLKFAYSDFGDIKATENSVQTVQTSTSGATKNLKKTESTTVIYSGGSLAPDKDNAPVVWGIIKTALYSNSSKYTVASEGYSVTYTETSGPKPLTDSCQITQDQKKLKTPEGFWVDNTPEMTFTK